MKLEICNISERITALSLFITLVAAGILAMVGIALPAAVLCFGGGLVFPALHLASCRARKGKPDTPVKPADETQLMDGRRELQETVRLCEDVFRRLSGRGLLPEGLSLEEVLHRGHDALDELEARADSLRGASRLNEIYYLIPYLKRLLEVITHKTEESALGLMEAYSSIQEKTAETARQGSVLLQKYGGEGEACAVDALIRDSLGQVDQEQDIISEMAVCTRDMAEKMEKLRGLVRESSEMLAQIEDITERSRLIGINLSIEASRIGGGAGRSFKVIVQELNRLNDRTSEFSGNIARQLAALGESFSLAKQDVEKTMHAAVARMEKKSGVLRESVERLTGSYEASSRISTVISESAISVNSDMDNILEHLQFQDITRQEAETVRDILTHIEELMKGSDGYFRLCGVPLENDALITEKITRSLLARAKVRDEMEAIVEVSHERSRG